MADELELFSAHQEDVRRRLDSLVRAVFVLANGMLAISIGIFVNSPKFVLSPYLLCVLRLSWWALFVAIVALVLTLSVIILRDYLLGERWRKKVCYGSDVNMSGQPTLIEYFIIAFAVIGLLSFIAGVFGLAFVSTNML